MHRTGARTRWFVSSSDTFYLTVITMSSPAPVAQAPAGGAAGAEAGEQPQQNQMQKVASLVLRMGVMYAFMMFMRSGKKEEGALDQQGT